MYNFFIKKQKYLSRVTQYRYKACDNHVKADELFRTKLACKSLDMI